MTNETQRQIEALRDVERKARGEAPRPLKITCDLVAGDYVAACDGHTASATPENSSRDAHKAARRAAIRAVKRLARGE